MPESEDDSDNLISQFVSKLDPGAMVTKYVMVAEGIDNDGDRASYTATHEGATSWDVIGLLIYSFAREFAAIVRTTLEAEEDGDEAG